jgi:threonine/homoserine/homoserine lactone efflux protein
MNSSPCIIFFTVALAHFLALLSPEPDFLLVVKNDIKNGDRKSTGVVAGIASANALYIALCIIGVALSRAAQIHRAGVLSGQIDRRGAGNDRTHDREIGHRQVSAE